MIHPTPLTAAVAAARADDLHRSAATARGRGRRRRARRVARVTAVALAVTASACAGGLGGGNGPTPTPTPPPPPPPSYERFVSDTVASIQTYWSTELPRLAGVPYKPIAGVHPYDPANQSTWPVCGGERVGEPQNAFYCHDGRFIAYDSPWLKQSIFARIGPWAVADILAHEWGHYVQAQLGINESPYAMEQQADCLAAAYLGWMARQGALRPDDEQQIVTAIYGLGDARPTRFEEEDGHGAIADRYAAYKAGRSGGAQACVSPTVDDAQGSAR